MQRSDRNLKAKRAKSHEKISRSYGKYEKQKKLKPDIEREYKQKRREREEEHT